MRTPPSTALGVGARAAAREAFRRGNQHRGQALVLRVALGGGRVAAARAGAPGDGRLFTLKEFERLLQRAQRVGGDAAWA